MTRPTIETLAILPAARAHEHRPGGSALIEGLYHALVRLPTFGRLLCFMSHGADALGKPAATSSLHPLAESISEFLEQDTAQVARRSRLTRPDEVLAPPADRPVFAGR